jgi:hypothetical protein
VNGYVCGCLYLYEHIASVLLQIWDQRGAEVSSKICKIIGADGGFARNAKNWPVEGMLTDVAYRWDVVRLCPGPVCVLHLLAQ